MIQLDLPYPPSVNRYWRHNRGVTHISAEGRKYREDVCRFARANLIETMDCPVAVDILLNPPDRRRRDVDNVLKAVLDGLQHGGILKDDSLVHDLRIRKLAVVRGGRCSLTITPITAA